jgi:hypothetical protein
MCANDQESHLKEAGCPHKKTGSRPIVLSQRAQIAMGSSDRGALAALMLMSWLLRAKGEAASTIKEAQLRA